MKLQSGYETRRGRIEIVPLIDVVFLLLVFFVYAMLSMTVYRGLRVNLPSGRGLTEDRDVVVIAIAADNTLWFDDAPVDAVEAVRLIRDRVSERDTPVLVSGDTAAHLGTAVGLLADLRDAGIQTVSFRVREDP